MNNKRPNIFRDNTVLLITVIFVFVVFIYFSYLTISSGDNLLGSASTNQTAEPTASDISEQEPGDFSGLESDEDVVLQEQPQVNPEPEFIIKMTKNLPFEGGNSALYYNPDGDSFIIYVDPENEDAGFLELDSFLLSNDIEEIEWLQNATLVSQKPTNSP